MKKVFSIFIMLFIVIFLFGVSAEAVVAKTTSQSQAKKAALLKIRQELLKTIVTYENAGKLMQKVTINSIEYHGRSGVA